MGAADYKQASLRLAQAVAVLRLQLAAERFRRELRYNPNWHLQPRVPAGNPDGGPWTACFFGAAGPLLPILQRVGWTAVARLREAARELAPRLRSVPRRWGERQPSEDSYDEETRRISPNSSQRHGHPNIRFRNEDELRRYLGPASAGREWHHIVEKRLAGRPEFPAELIHSTDNIISLPVEVHHRVTARMNTRDRAY